jgi:3-phytase
MSSRLARTWIAATLLITASLATAETAPASVAASMQTPALEGAEPNSAILVLDPEDATHSRIVATAALNGIQVYAMDGRLLSRAAAGDVASVDVAYNVALGAGRATVIAAIDTTDNRLRFYTMQADTLTEVSARTILLGFAAEGVCFCRSRLDGALYTFVVGDGGEVDQHLIHATTQGKLDAHQVRRIAVPSPLTQCVADSEGQVYAAEEGVGIWRFNANAEADVSARLIDAPGLGHIEEEVGGVALYDGGAGQRWLIASDASAGRLNIYDRGNDDVYLGSIAVTADAAAVEEPGPLFATSMALGATFPHGMLLIADEEGANYKALSIAALAQSIARDPGGAQDPRRAALPPVAVISARYETAPTGSYGDAADDPAIWAHPSDPAKSLVVATDKKAGLYVYDMQGRVVHFLADGKMNNIDLRDGFMLDGKPVTLVTASDRTRKAIAIYRLDSDKRQLVNIADGLQPTGLEDPYGLCMYRSAKNRKTYVFINSGDGPLHQWLLTDAGNSRVKSRLVRKLRFETQTEGCVADDATGVLYVGEEDAALWRMNAEPNGGSERTAVDRVVDNPAIKDDLEGVGLYDLGGGRGYLVVSSQGNDTYAVYRREGKQEYLGSFAVVADPASGIDGISETDGLDVSSHDLGPGFEHGAMVAQDGRNVLPVENQNYKYVSWDDIARVLKLEVRKH